MDEISEKVKPKDEVKVEVPTRPEFNKHIERKSSAHTMNKEDKRCNDPEISVWTMDSDMEQCFLSCSNTQTRAMYYKTKPMVDNMTYYNLKTKEGYLYVFDVTNGDFSNK